MVAAGPIQREARANPSGGESDQGDGAASAAHVAEAIRAARLAAEPFRHFEVPAVFSPPAAARLLEWLETSELVRPRTADFYRSSGFNVGPDDVPDALRDLVSKSLFDQVRAAVEEKFSVKLTSTVYLTANHYGRGDGTLVHTDYQAPGHRDEFYMTHRFIVYLNRTWEPADGGRLGLFDSIEESSLRATLPPLHNSAVGIEIGPKSYHAVSRVRSGDRYSLNFAFTATDPDF